MKHRRTRDVVIELTSLLDIVMILIFAVMIENSKLVKAGREELAVANAELVGMEDELSGREEDIREISQKLEDEIRAHEDAVKEKDDLTAAWEAEKSEMQNAREEKEKELNEAITGLSEEKEKLLLELSEALSEKEALEGEKAELSEKLLNALGKLEEGDVSELLQRLQNAKTLNEAYEYMDDIVVVFDISLENKYNDTARVLSFGKMPKDDEGICKEVWRVTKGTLDIEWNMAVNELRMFLSAGIAETLENADEDTVIYMIFSYNNDTVYNDDLTDIIAALTEIEASDISGKIRLRRNIITE